MVQNRELEQGIFLQKLVIDAMRKYNCKTVRDLVTRLQIIDHSLTVEDICAIVKALEKEKKIVLAHPQVQYSFFGYLTKSIASLPFWLAIVYSSNDSRCCIYSISNCRAAVVRF